jgi:UDP-glucose 4-epimerase
MPAKKTGKKKQKVLVTGAAGVLAQQTIARLSGSHPIVAVDFRRAVEIGPDIPSYRVDFLKRGLEDVFRQHDIGTVIHIGRIGTDIGGKFFRYNANVIGTQKLYDLCVKYNVNHVVMMSSYFVYGASPYNPALLDEDTPLKASDLTLNLIDTVELENLSQIYLYKHPQLNMQILRPTNIAGPGVRNNIGRLLSRRWAPVLMGFNPVMQFIHVLDLADAISLLLEKPKKAGIYNLAPNDWVPYKTVLSECNIHAVPFPSVPTGLTVGISRWLNWKAFPSYLVNYFKYPVIIDGGKFERTFGFKPARSLEEIFTHYRELKKEPWV